MKRSDLLSIISTLDVKKATRLDGITAKILKSSGETVCPSLLKILYISIASGLFPNSLKLATHTVPVYKSGPQNDPLLTDRSPFFLFCQKSLKNMTLNTIRIFE